MFSEKWFTEMTVKMDDNVQFDQFETFKLFIDIIYGLIKEDDLTVGQATAVFFYSEKYQVDTMKERIYGYVEDKIDVGWLSATELEEVFNFIKFFGYDDLIKSLDQMELNLDAGNCYEFYQLADRMQLPRMKQQISVCCETFPPNPKWSCEFLCLVIEKLQRKMAMLEEELKGIRGKKTPKGVSKHCQKLDPEDQ